MPEIQIANPVVVAEIERLSRMTGLGKTAAVEAAATRMIEESGAPTEKADPWSRFDAVLKQIRALPVRPILSARWTMTSSGFPSDGHRYIGSCRDPIW